MKYEGKITDAKGEWNWQYISADTRWDALQKLLNFARHENILADVLKVRAVTSKDPVRKALNKHALFGSKEKPR